MEKTWKWSGKNDETTLYMLKQIGIEGIVTALYDIPDGEVWPLEAITELNDYIKDAGLRWSVVEDLPVNETIRLGGENADKMIDNYVRSLANLGEAGINTVCYNFMPAAEPNTSIKENFKYFLSQLMPVCEEYNINMCINPRNPSYSTPPHPVISEDIEWILKAVDNPYNGLTFHLDSSGGANIHNNLLQQAKKFASRIHFIYLHNADVISIGKDMETSPHPENREQLIELIRFFEKENPFLPMCINHNKDSFQSRMYAMAQIDGTIATLKYEINK